MAAPVLRSPGWGVGRRSAGRSLSLKRNLMTNCGARRPATLWRLGQPAPANHRRQAVSNCAFTSSRVADWPPLLSSAGTPNMP